MEKYGKTYMDLSVEDDTLAKRYPFLPEDAEDIAYRMYDLFVRKHPKLKSLLNGSREFHIQLFISLIDSPGNFENNHYSICLNCNKSLETITNHPYLIKHPNILSLNRGCLIKAIEDVLFDEAHPQLVRECKGVYDEICSKIQSHKLINEKWYRS